MADISNWISRPVPDPRFTKLAQYICDFNIETGPWIAGGSVRKLWQGVGWVNEDVDVFFSSLKSFESIVNIFGQKYKRQSYNVDYDLDQLELSVVTLSELNATEHRLPTHRIVSEPVIHTVHETDNAMSIKLVGFNDITLPNNYIDLQFISRTFPKSAEELLIDFDWTVCQFISDGVTMWATPNAVKDLERRQLELVPNTTRPITFKRIIKYLSYGFDPTDEIMIKMMKFLETGTGIGVEDDYI